jgi:hypothetical protein
MTNGDGAAGDAFAARFAIMLTVTAHGPRGRDQSSRVPAGRHACAWPARSRTANTVSVHERGNREREVWTAEIISARAVEKQKNDGGSGEARELDPHRCATSVHRALSRRPVQECSVCLLIIANTNVNRTYETHERTAAAATAHFHLAAPPL